MSPPFAALLCIALAFFFIGVGLKKSKKPFPLTRKEEEKLAAELDDFDYAQEQQAYFSELMNQGHQELNNIRQLRNQLEQQLAKLEGPFALFLPLSAMPWAQENAEQEELPRAEWVDEVEGLDQL